MMKAKFIRDDVRYSGPVPPEEKYADSLEERDYRGRQVLYWKNGAIIDNPEAYRLVQQGVAESADDECRERANKTPEQLAEARYAYERLRKGIHPDDFDDYDGGVMDGYDDNGQPIPGPNAEDDDDE